jgi:hypothetical protein
MKPFVTFNQSQTPVTLQDQVPKNTVIKSTCAFQAQFQEVPVTCKLGLVSNQLVTYLTAIGFTTLR